MNSAISQSSVDDPTAVRRLLYPHASRLIAFIDRHIPPILRRLIDPQDIAQDAFVLASRAIATVPKDGSESVWRWLATIAKNRLTDIVIAQQTAKRGGGRLHELDADTNDHSVIIEVLEELAVHERTPSRSAVRREFLVALEQSLNQIDISYRDAIRMRYIEGLSLQETAAKMKKSTDSAQKLCSRALGELRISLRSISRYM